MVALLPLLEQACPEGKCVSSLLVPNAHKGLTRITGPLLESRVKSDDTPFVKLLAEHAPHAVVQGAKAAIAKASQSLQQKFVK